MKSNITTDSKILFSNLESDMENNLIRYIHTYHDKKADEWHFIFYGNEDTYTKVSLLPNSFTHTICKITNEERLETVVKWSHGRGDFCCYKEKKEMSGIFNAMKKLIQEGGV